MLAVGKRMLVCCTERLWYSPKNTKKAFKLSGRMVAWNCLKSQYRHFREKKYGNIIEVLEGQHCSSIREEQFASLQLGIWKWFICVQLMAGYSICLWLPIN